MKERSNKQLVTYVVDDDDAVRDALSLFLEVNNIHHITFASANEFFDAYDNQQLGCLILDVRMPGMDGLALQQKLNALLSRLPVIFISGHGDIPMAVEAMRNGALDFIRKPIDQTLLLKRINEAYQQITAQQQSENELSQLIERYQSLTKREIEVFDLVCAGVSNKSIAADLSISERTVEVHRAKMMQKFAVGNLAELVKIHVTLNQSR